MITFKLEALTWSSHDLTFFQASNLAITVSWIALSTLNFESIGYGSWVVGIWGFCQVLGQFAAGYNLWVSCFLRLKFAGHEHCVLKGNGNIGVWFSFFLLRLSCEGGSLFTSEWVEIQAPGARFRSSESNFSGSWFRGRGKIFDCDL